MAEEDEWKKLSADQKVQHTSWKARAEGYKECIKNFAMYDEKSPEFGKYLGLVKKFVTDSNELNRIQGLQAALIFVENAHVAGKTCLEVVSGVTTKCFNAKPRLRELGIDLCLMYIEIDRNEPTVEELIKGFSNKQPKIIHACLDAVTKALSAFGAKVVSVKPIMKQAIKLIDHRDKNVREAAKALFIEIYRWIGPAIKVPLQGINAVVLKELEEEWEKLGPGGNGKQTRFMRSQQDLREKHEASAAGSGDAGADVAEEEQEVIDPFDLLQPQEILSQLPKTFYDDIEAKKWQERKIALEACEKLAKTPRLAADNYGDLVKALKKVLSKDTNIMLVIIAIKCLGGLAAGLRKKFQPFALVCLDGMFERFKEKKLTVVTALHEACDAIYLSTNLQAISETCIETLGSKNPSIRAQTGFFLARSIAKTKASVFNKALMKLYLTPLLKNIDHSTPDVRDASYQAIGTMLKLVGEAKIQPFLCDLDKLKRDKINEFAGKAEVAGGKAAPAPSASTTSSKPVTSFAPKKSASSTNKAVKPSTSSQSVKTVKGGKKSAPAKPKPEQPAVENELGEEVVEELVLKVISAEEKGQILNMNWKERLAGLQSASQKIKMLERSELPCQAFVKFLSIKPGLKDNNFNCLIEKFKIIEFLAQNGKFTRTSASVCLPATVDKVGDVKCGAAAKNVLSAMAEAAGFPWVVEEVVEKAMSQKNPKIQSETLTWLANAIKEFGIAGLNVKLVIEKIKAALAATNPAVRSNGLALIGVMSLFIGEKMRMFFENEKPALLQQIDSELAKTKGESAPAPTRGLKKSSSNVANDASDDEEEPEKAINFDDMVTRVDISSKITDGLIAQMSDKNWKERKEALETLTGIINEAKFVEPNLGDLPGAIKARLSDSNKILLMTTLNILAQLAKALGPHCSKHLQVFRSGLIGVLADSKPQVRQSALNCMAAWSENTKLFMWLEGDTISSALAVAKHINLRIELFNWLADKLTTVAKLPASAKEGMELCIPVLYSCCEDRSGEVRAKAQACLPVFMRHLSYDKMLRGTAKLGASSKSAISTLLEKAREQMPPPAAPPAKKAKSEPAKKRAPEPEPMEEPAVEREARPKQSAAKQKRPASVTRKKAPASSRKAAPEEEVAELFIKLPNGKEQRRKDEVKLKTIKWVFAVPREELVVQLQQQLQTCLSSSLITEMFHADFQHHLKAIGLLLQGISSEWDSTVQCMDILLRWFTLRFYDKNTTVHIKCLEYIKALFEKLIQTDYKATDYELSSFLPHLIIKIGENKDNIRKAVHGILKQVSLVYPASKLFNYVMDGTKSKNSRQRSECLDRIASLIETYGVSVCQPTAPKALKEMAAHISDRDKGVRSSALNAIVAAYNVSGNVVFKQVGRLNEKDMSMLEERIKRSGKYNEAAATAAPPSNAEQTPVETSTKPTKEAATRSIPQSKSNTANKTASLTAMRELHSSGVDEEYTVPPKVAEIMSQVVDINAEHLLEPLPYPKFLKDFNEANALSNANATLDIIVSQMSSPDMTTCITAFQELWEILKSDEKLPLLEGRVDQLLTASSTQLRMTTNRYLPAIASRVSDRSAEITETSFMSFCKSHLAILMKIFNSPRLSSRASGYVMFDLVRCVIQLLLNEQLSSLQDANRLTQALNQLVLRMLENSDPTAINCAIIQVLHDGMDGGSGTYIDLVIKCLWKLGRMAPNFLPPMSPGKEGEFRHRPLNVAAVLAKMDRFWSTYPKTHAAYTRLQTNVPLRSIKTVLTMLCKQMGPKIADELYMIPKPASSDVVETIHRQTGISRSDLVHRASTTADRKENIDIISGVSLEAKLSQIFKKVADLEQSHQGLLDLYEFKQDNPTYDLDRHIESLDVDMYRDYVKRGLMKINAERQAKLTGVPVHVPSASSKDYAERINSLRVKCGLPPLDKNKMRTKCGFDPIDTNSAKTSETDNKVLVPSASANLTLTSSRAAKNGTSSNGENPPARGSASSSSLSDLKRRLEQIKQGSLPR